MNLTEATQLLAVLGPILGLVATVLGGVIWVMKKHLQSREERLAELRLKVQSLDADVAKAQAEAKKFQYERDEAEHRKKVLEQSFAPLTKENEELKREVGGLKEQLDKAKKEKDLFYNAGVEQRTKRKAAEARADKAEADAKAAESARKGARLEADEAQVAVENLKTELAAANRRREEEWQLVESSRAERDAAQATAAALEKQIEAIANQDGKVWHATVGPDVPRFVPLPQRRTPIISVLNLKGGVGKTTITANLGGYLAATAGKRVLLIDLDHQRSLTQLLLSTDERKAAANARHTVQDFFLSTGRTGQDLCNVARLVAGFDNLSVVSNTDVNQQDYQYGGEKATGTRQNLDDLEMSFLGRWLVDPGRLDVRFLLREAAHSEAVTRGYDYVLIDCPPRLTTACISALTASDFVLIPAQAEQVSVQSVPHLLRRLRGLQATGVLAELRLLGIVANRVTARAQDADSSEAKILAETAAVALQMWGRPVQVFDTKLRDSGHYLSVSRELEKSGELTLAVDKPAVREQYHNLFQEIEVCIHEHVGVTGVPA